MSAAGQTLGNSFGRDGAREVSATSRSPEDLQRKARPEGERPNNHPNKLLLARIAFMEKYEVDYSESSYFVF